MKNYHRTAILIVVGVSFLTACLTVKPTYFDDDKKRAQIVVDQFHKFYNEQNYEAIFNAAHEDARRTKSKEGLGLVLAQAFERDGKHIGSELVFSKVQTLGVNERQVEMVFKSRFERGTRNETFLIVTNDQNGALHSIGEISDEELEKLK